MDRTDIRNRYRRRLLGWTVVSIFVGPLLSGLFSSGPSPSMNISFAASIFDDNTGNEVGQLESDFRWKISEYGWPLKSIRIITKEDNLAMNAKELPAPNASEAARRQARNQLNQQARQFDSLYSPLKIDYPALILDWSVFSLPLALFAWLLCWRGYQKRLQNLEDHICIGCSYDLTANVSGVCPECGLAFGSQD